MLLSLIFSLIPPWLETAYDFSPLDFDENCFTDQHVGRFINVLYTFGKNVYSAIVGTVPNRANLLIISAFSVSLLVLSA